MKTSEHEIQVEWTVCWTHRWWPCCASGRRQSGAMGGDTLRPCPSLHRRAAETVEEENKGSQMALGAKKKWDIIVAGNTGTMLFPLTRLPAKMGEACTKPLQLQSKETGETTQADSREQTPTSVGIALICFIIPGFPPRNWVAFHGWGFPSHGRGICPPGCWPMVRSFW